MNETERARQFLGRAFLLGANDLSTRVNYGECRERERERDRQIDRQTDRQTDRQIESQEETLLSSDDFPVCV